MHNSLDAKVVVKWTSTYISSYPGYCSARNIEMLSTEGFYFQKKKGLLQHAVDNEVAASARLPVHGSLSIGQETSVRFSYYCVFVSSGLNLKKKALPWDKENCP